MLFSVIVLQFLVYPGRLYLRWLSLDEIIINDNHYDLNLWATVTPVSGFSSGLIIINQLLQNNHGNWTATD